MPTTRPRHSVPLTEEELDELAAARTPGTAEHEALVELTAEPADSAAAILRALLSLGRRVLHEHMAESSYAAEAAAADAEGAAARRALRARLLARAGEPEAS